MKAGLLELEPHARPHLLIAASSFAPVRVGVAQVQRDRALVARLHLPPDRGAVLNQTPVAQRVAAARRLDLDHVGTELAQCLAGPPVPI